MNKKTLFSLILILFVMGVVAYVYSPKSTTLSYDSALKIEGSKEYKAFTTYPYLSKGNIDSLRILNDKKEEVPYFINSYSDFSSKNKYTYYTSTLLKLKSTEDYTTYDYKLENPLNNTPLVSTIMLEVPKGNFSKDISVFSSVDGENWSLILEDTIYRNDDSEKTFVKLPKEFFETYYRISFKNESENFRILDVAFSLNDLHYAKFSNNISADFTTEELENTTILTIPNDNFKNLNIKHIALVAGDEYFYRNVSSNFNFDGVVSKAPTSDNLGSVENTQLSINSTQTSDEDLILTIDNENDRPLYITDVYITYYNDYVVFKDEGSSSYILTYSNDTTAVAPKYDIVNFKDNILEANNIDLVTISDQRTVLTSTSFENQNPNNVILYNIVLGGVSFVIFIVILRNISAKGSEL